MREHGYRRTQSGAAVSDNPATVPEWMGKLAAANIRIAALDAENELLRGHKDALIERYQKAEAERDALKRCGNCDRWNSWDTPTSCAVDSLCAFGFKPCHFTPSRWAERSAP